MNESLRLYNFSTFSRNNATDLIFKILNPLYKNIGTMGVGNHRAFCAEPFPVNSRYFFRPSCYTVQQSAMPQKIQCNAMFFFFFEGKCQSNVVECTIAQQFAFYLFFLFHLFQIQVADSYSIAIALTRQELKNYKNNFLKQFSLWTLNVYKFRTKCVVVPIKIIGSIAINYLEI